MANGAICLTWLTNGKKNKKLAKK